MIIQRDIEQAINKHFKNYPVIGLTGPRQSGKTTLTKLIFKGHKYVTLEDIDTKRYAASDPRGFLTYESKYQGLIIDEIQNVPELFSYIQSIVDNNKKASEYILTGSQNFLLLEKITQSLAGRIALFNLLPLSISELKKNNLLDVQIDELLYKGFYPKLHSSKEDIEFWYKNYINTYLEKDIRQIKNIKDLLKFQHFIKLCAARVGQLFNYSSIASECGINDKTVKEWLSILHASFIIYFLRPYHEGFGKRLVKQPKLYFYDTGLVNYLLDIKSPKQLSTHYIKGQLFENLIANELVKLRLNQGRDPNIYFWRDNHGHEIDVMIENAGELIPVEIKSGMTVNSDYFKNIKFWSRLIQFSKSYVIYSGLVEQNRSDGTKIINWKKVPEVFSWL